MNRRTALRTASGTAALAAATTVLAQTHGDVADEAARHDKMDIREILEKWAVYRDAGDWERFATVWNSDGYMMATWFQGPAADFIKVSRDGFEKGASTILHFLGGSAIDVAGSHAIAQTKMTITQRAKLDGTLVDVICTGRFYDFLEKRNGKWGITLRRLFYEQDRMIPINPSTLPAIDQKLLASFPSGYQHLGYLQTKLGFKVKPDMPGLKGPQAAALYALGKRWLAGEKMDVSFKK